MSQDESGKPLLNAEHSRPVYLVDDDDELRQGLGAILGDRGFEVEDFESGYSFLAAVPRLPAGCVLADLRMADGDGFELLQGLRDRSAQFPVVMITGYADVPAAVQAMKLGAVDFIEKPFSIHTIVDLIRTTAQRCRSVLEEDAAGTEDEQARRRLATLTPRERDVLAGVVNGWTNRLIAQSLNISQRTVELHRAHLMDKLGARNVSQLVRLALVGR